jgi:small subunit ribosomal protein S18
MRKYKKRPNVLHAEHIGYIDYKDVNLLQRFMSDRSKLRARRMNGNTVQQQRDVALAVKNAREMALLPYTKRVAAARAPRRGEEDGGSRSDRPRRGAPNADAGSNESAFVDKYAAAIDAAESSVAAPAADVEVSTPTTTEEA